MTFVPHSRVLPRALWRPAIFFFAVAQFLLAFSPLLEAKQGPDSRAHVEEAGTTLHHAHNDADCTACVARALLANAETEHQEQISFLRQASTAPDAREASLTSSGTRLSRSRAPPALIA